MVVGEGALVLHHHIANNQITWVNWYKETRSCLLKKERKTLYSNYSETIRDFIARKSFFPALLGLLYTTKRRVGLKQVFDLEVFENASTEIVGLSNQVSNQ